MKHQKTPNDTKFLKDFDSWIKKKMRRNIDPYNLALDAVSWAKNYLNAGTWINVKDDLPKVGTCDGIYDHVPVFAYNGSKVIPCYFTIYDEGIMFMTDEGLRITNVTHWMAAPNSPKE
jgi:hypothetical protein